MATALAARPASPAARTPARRPDPFATFNAYRYHDLAELERTTLRGWLLGIGAADTEAERIFDLAFGIGAMSTGWHCFHCDGESYRITRYHNPETGEVRRFAVCLQCADAMEA